VLCCAVATAIVAVATANAAVLQLLYSLALTQHLQTDLMVAGLLLQHGCSAKLHHWIGKLCSVHSYATAFASCA
jgi:hypothetical protein